MEKLILDNGLEVYLNEKPLGETAVYLGINAGFLHSEIFETPHILEHMQGTKARVYGEKGVLNYVTANALTNYNRTIYYFENILPEHAHKALDNLCETMVSLNNNYLETEKNIIYHEFAPSNNPLYRLSEKNFSALFPRFFKKVPDMQTRINLINNVHKDTVEKFWQEHYAPSNSFLCIAGEMPKTLDKNLKKFNSLKSNGKKSKKIEYEDEIELKEHIEIKESVRDDDIASIIIAYQSPPYPKINHKEFVAINFLSEYLSSTSGILYGKLRDKHELCYSLNVVHDQNPGYSVFYFQTSTKPELCHKVESEWLGTIKEIANNGVPNNFIETIKNKSKIIALHMVRDFDLGSVISFMDHNLTHEDFLKEANNITKEDIIKAANLFANKPHIISIALPRK